MFTVHATAFEFVLDYITFDQDVQTQLAHFVNKSMLKQFFVATFCVELGKRKVNA